MSLFYSRAPSYALPFLTPWVWFALPTEFFRVLQLFSSRRRNLFPRTYFYPSAYGTFLDLVRCTLVLG